MSAFGWSWEYVDENMTLPRFEAIARVWERTPPMHELLAAFFLSKKSDVARDAEGRRLGTAENPRNDEELQQMMGELGMLGLPISSARPEEIIGVRKEDLH